MMMLILLLVFNYFIHMVETTLCIWPPEFLEGRQPLNRTEYDYCTLEKVNSFMDSASYRPNHCRPRQTIAVIVPYRDREPQLKIFLLNVLPKMKRQNLSFTVFVIEQSGQELFNKGALINIGFLEAVRHGEYDCFIIHDVDILPEDDRNFYTCGDNPRNLAVLVEQFGYSLFDSEYLGGIATFTKKQFQSMNGFSNIYKGWGIEDDDAYRRVRSAGYRLDRPENNVSYCGSIEHVKSSRDNDRCFYFLNYGRYWNIDGLNSIRYKIIQSTRNKLFHWFLADFDTDQMRQKLKKSAKDIRYSLRSRRFPSNLDDYCKWFLFHLQFNLDRKQCKVDDYRKRI